MKLSVSTYSLWRWRKEQNKSLEDTIDLIADLGAAGVEFSGLDEQAQADPIRRARSLRRRCEKRGVAVAGYCVGAELLRVPAEQDKAVEQTKRHVEVAVELGCKTMRHDVSFGFDGEHAKGLRGPRTFEAALKIIVPAVRRIADHGQSHGVVTTLENHGFFMQESRRVETLIKTVEHPNFALTIDMGNFLCVNEDPVKAVARLAKRAVMAHVKDFHVRDKSNVPPTGWFNTPTSIALRGAIAGHGAIDIPAELKLLKKAGYDGWLSLEFEGIEDPAQGVKLGLDYLRREMKALGVLS